MRIEGVSVTAVLLAMFGGVIAAGPSGDWPA